MSRIEQVCERINDTFVVKCVEQVQPETYLGLAISDFISAIIAFFSVLAAGFAAYAAWKANKLSESEAIANREHKIFSVRPILEFEYTFSKINKEFILVLQNNGLGPAIISNLSTCLHGEEIKDMPNFERVVDQLLQHDKYFYVCDRFFYQFQRQVTILPGKQVEVVSFRVTSSTLKDNNQFGDDGAAELLELFKSSVRCEVESSDMFQNQQPKLIWIGGF